MSAQHLRDALSGPHGALDMYLECNDEKQVRADILALNGTDERRKFAAMAMQGILADPNSHVRVPSTTLVEPGFDWMRYVAECAVGHADALLATLQRPQRGEGE